MRYLQRTHYRLFRASNRFASAAKSSSGDFGGGGRGAGDTAWDVGLALSESSAGGMSGRAGDLSTVSFTSANKSGSSSFDVVVGICSYKGVKSDIVTYPIYRPKIAKKNTLRPPSPSESLFP